MGISQDFVAPTGPEPGERPLDPVRRFLNTFRQEEGVDRLESPESAREWLADQGYGTLDLSARQLTAYTRARELIRSLLLGDPAAVEALDGLVGRRVKVRPAFGVHGGRVVGGIASQTVEPAFRPLQAIIAALWRGAASGELARLKVCAEPRCRLAFYDQSRNLSRVWCTSGECGNRNRVARHRARRASRGG